LGRDRDELIKNIKANVPDNEQLSKIEKLAENYKDKTDDEIFFEIIKINKEMENELSPEKYNEH
jgi:sulfite reductase beta subunit-like hemoprotein